MTCNPTRIEISNAAATVVEFTVTPDPGSVSLTFQVDALSIDETITLSAGVGSVTIASQTQADFSIFDGTIQVGSGSAILVPVMVIESNVQQAVGVNISGTDVTYCAPTSGGGTTPSEPVIEYVYGTHSLLAEIKEQPAHVSFVGDSISNNSDTAPFTTLFHGALFEWRPNTWKGAWFTTEAGSAGILVQANGNAAAAYRAGYGSTTGNPYESSSPTKTKTSNTDSTQDWQLQFQFKWLSATQANRGAGTTSFFSRWPDGSYIFRDADGSQTLAKYNTQISMAAQMIGHGQTGYATSMRTRMFETFTGQSAVQVAPWASGSLTDGADYWSDTIERSYLTLQDFDGDTGGFWTLHLDDATSTSGDRQTIESVFWGSDRAGLEISYFGAGSWTTRNHYPPGDEITYNPEEPGEITDTWHYTNDALGGRMAALGTTHAFVFIGMNDISSAFARTGEETLEGFDQMLTNMRTERPGIKFVVLTLYTGDADNQAKIDAKATFNAGVKSRAEAASDIAVIDLNQYIVDTWGTQTAFSNAWLADGVHPNQVGAAAMTSWIWSKIVESTGGVTSVQGRTGQVVLTAADFDPVADSYIMLVEAPTTKTYVLDVASVAGRTITAFRGRTSAGSCAVTLKSNGGSATVASITASATAAPTSATSLNNTDIAIGERIELEVTSNLSAENLQIVVDYTQ